MSRPFSEALATDLMLPQQLTPGAGCTSRRGPCTLGGVSPCPTDPSIFHPKRTAAEPAPHTVPFSPCSLRRPSSRAEGQPAIAPQCLCARTPTWPSRDPAPRGSSVSGTQRAASPPRGTWSEGNSFSTGPRLGATACTHDNGKGWEGVTGRTATCLQRLCCCLPCFCWLAPKTDPAFRNKVAPVRKES